MANEKRLIDTNGFKSAFYIKTKEGDNEILLSHGKVFVAFDAVQRAIENAPTVDAVEVVRCQNCVHAEPLDRNCELSTTHYLHCKLWRGEETKNVWHKYKKYHKDYSLVERDGYCDAGAKMDGGNEDV